MSSSETDRNWRAKKMSVYTKIKMSSALVLTLKTRESTRVVPRDETGLFRPAHCIGRKLRFLAGMHSQQKREVEKMHVARVITV